MLKLVSGCTSGMCQPPVGLHGPQASLAAPVDNTVTVPGRTVFPSTCPGYPPAHKSYRRASAAGSLSSWLAAGIQAQTKQGS
jgi:hypothetical protein